MSRLPDAVPLNHQRACLQQYLRGIVFSFTSVAGRIIQERLPGDGAGDPLRPSLVLWACGANRGDIDDALPVAAAFELFDRFMRLHDELAEESPATVVRWGLGQSLNAGDALYAVAFRCLASEVAHPRRRLDAAKLVTEAVLEAIDGGGAGIARGAALTGAALQSGAIVGGAHERMARRFGRAGRVLGMAALVDDAALAERLSNQAVAVLRGCTAAESLAAFEEVAQYVARRAA
jgi:geranylgeranyl pyrophosphate synthase